ncbi:helix-turn-helix domain-containing protein [Bacillus salipaludis]|uniref:Helix-turn-helix domain-containing protein n=1 Tax=Bacillus salipaludis TaxID=2547811 RepID=A0A4V3AT95_9BACI|nr:helix-turn-helix domain-containing protein [Bacillus salipaludis]MDQ6599239.1 helix-turn-helix domain-containing protein [Bacillus salipaludis]TDK58882.1 helix-turn-helix domain-containing protein [Bacillus salipaludis]
MTSNKMMLATAQALSTRTDYDFKSMIETINEYFDFGTQEYNAFLYIAGLSELCQGVSFPSQSKIAEKLGVDRTRANKIVAQLVEKGLLIVVKVEGIRNNFYIIPTIVELMSKVSDMIQAITSKTKETIKKTAEKVQKIAQEVAEKDSNVIGV